VKSGCDLGFASQVFQNAVRLRRIARKQRLSAAPATQVNAKREDQARLICSKAIVKTADDDGPGGAAYGIRRPIQAIQSCKILSAKVAGDEIGHYVRFDDQAVAQECCSH
jgi:hypothetical protein